MRIHIESQVSEGRARVALWCTKGKMLHVADGALERTAEHPCRMCAELSGQVKTANEVMTRQNTWGSKKYGGHMGRLVRSRSFSRWCKWMSQELRGKAGQAWKYGT